jgi:ribosomal protein S18 acetylase RimI-like enzyme
MDTIQYRPATLEDLPILYGFEQGIITAERPFDSTLKPDPISYYDLKSYISSHTVEVIVAHNGEEVIASGYAKIMEGKEYHKHKNYAYLGFMYVKPEYRGNGIIKNITNALISWAKSKAIFEVRLEVYNDNSSAIRAYEKSGFKKHMVEMRVDIS